MEVIFLKWEHPCRSVEVRTRYSLPYPGMSQGCELQLQRFCDGFRFSWLLGWVEWFSTHGWLVGFPHLVGWFVTPGWLVGFRHTWLAIFTSSTAVENAKFCDNLECLFLMVLHFSPAAQLRNCTNDDLHHIRNCNVPHHTASDHTAHFTKLHREHSAMPNMSFVMFDDQHLSPSGIEWPLLPYLEAGGRGTRLIWIEC